MVKCCKPKYLCLPSKAAVLIIIWTTVVGAAFSFIKDFMAFFVVSSKYSHIHDVGTVDLIPYAILAVMMMFYPLSGFIADVWCGRFKTVMVSMSLIFISLLFAMIASSINLETMLSGAHLKFTSHNSKTIIMLIILVLSLLCFLTGIVGYQANYIQLGLDQLLEAPSEYLGLFIHYASWTFGLGSVLDSLVFSLSACHSASFLKALSTSLLIGISITILLMLTIMFTITCWKRKRWFYVEPGQQNPYEIVYKVLHFARKHKYPLQRSAFTYCDDYIPSRLDFAKQRYGGPFTTEQVENVKTLFRILVVLMATGPTYLLTVSASQYIFPLFSFHLGKEHFSAVNCSIQKVLLTVVTSGYSASLFTNIIIFPIYIWVIFVILRKKVPKIFTRLGVGIVLSLLGVLTMSIIDVVGHSMSQNGTEQDYSNETHCMFLVKRLNYTLEYEPLNMHWSVAIVPSVFLGIGPLLITTTTLEFISAQSPHSMKGLLVGVSFAIQGFFQLLGIIVILPFSLTQPWPKKLPSVVSCGFVYFLIILSTGLLGFVLFIIAAKKYKYRERDDINFCQRDIEEVYTRYLIQATESNVGGDTSSD